MVDDEFIEAIELLVEVEELMLGEEESGGLVEAGWVSDLEARAGKSLSKRNLGETRWAQVPGVGERDFPSFFSSALRRSPRWEPREATAPPAEEEEVSLGRNL